MRKNGHFCQVRVYARHQPAAMTGPQRLFPRAGTLARAMLLCLSMSMLGCFPPTLELEPPVDPNSPPVTLSVRGPTGDELPWPGPVTLARGATTATLVVRDVDLTDSLYVQFFVDYGLPDPVPTRTPGCRLGPVAVGSNPNRTITCDIRGVCLPGDIGVARTLLIDAYDREPELGSDGDLFRAVPEPGYRYEKVYDLLCVDSVFASGDAAPSPEASR